MSIFFYIKDCVKSFYLMLVKSVNSELFNSVIFYLLQFSLIIPIFLIIITFFFYMNIKRVSVPFNKRAWAKLLFISLISFFYFYCINNIGLSLNFMFSLNMMQVKTITFVFYLSNEFVMLTYMVLIIFLFTSFYSNFYLKKDASYNRFFFFLTLFATSMIFLILSQNIISIFIFWEAIGISSFFLISYYNNKISNFKSGLKAMLFNMSSDLIFIVIVLLHYQIFNGFLLINSSFYVFESSFKIWNLSINKLGFMLLLVSFICFIKSAQFLFSVWLIDSMDAPVPASALIHSATLVIAGIVIILKYKNYFLLYPNLTTFILFVSSFTALISSLSACYQTDLKRLLAHSTINNCSFMIILVLTVSKCDFLNFTLAHGFLKSYLFLVCGVLFLFNNHKQDIRYMSNHGNKYLTVYWSIYFYMCFLSTFPFLISFDIKHSIFQNYNNYGKIMYYFIYISITVSSLFSFLYGYNLINILISVKNYNSTNKNNFYKITKKDAKIYRICLTMYATVIWFFFILFYTSNFITISEINVLSGLSDLNIIHYIYIIGLLLSIPLILTIYNVFFKNFTLNWSCLIFFFCFLSVMIAI